MNRCWTWAPQARPRFSDISSSLSVLNGVSSPRRALMEGGPRSSIPSMRDTRVLNLMVHDGVESRRRHEEAGDEDDEEYHL